MNLLWSYLRRFKKTLALALGLAAVNQIFSLLDPQIFRLIIDRYATRAHELPPNEFLRGTIILLLGAVGVAFVSRVAKNFQDYYVNVIAQRLGAALYGDGVAHAFALPYGVFEDQRSGEVLQKLQKARTDAQAFITSAINIVFLSLVGITFVLGYAFIVHWTIGLTYFLTIPALGLTSFMVSRKIKLAQARIVRQTADLAGSTTETLRNVELVKSLGLEAQETLRLNLVNERILELELAKVKLIRRLSFIQGTTVNALRSGIMLLMLWLIAQGDLTLGQFFSLLFYSFFIFAPLGELGTVATQFQEARASLEALQQVLALKPEPQPSSPIDPGELKTVSFKGVNFSYGSSKQYSVADISLEVKSGQTIAFVGPSGSGKSTLVKLLVGLYPPTSGTLAINGTPVTQIKRDALKARIGYVSQETQLFSGTIRENLLFVRPEASDNDCLDALTQAAATSLLERGGQGLDSKIGEGGIKLSGGERQRLAIARALLRKPDLIIFDEATSSLDSLTERAITETIHSVSDTHQNLMTILVAHRLATVAHAHQIYVLEHGRIIELGTHLELVRQGGLYTALWRSQQADNGER